MVNREINEFASRLTASLGKQLESITYYPHPFTNGGLVIVPNDEVKFIPDLLANIYACHPPAIALYCLRRVELFQLSDPGLFGWPNPLEEKPHLAFWLKYEGELLYGRDIREEIQLPADTGSFLEIHLQRVKHCIRNWAFDQFYFKKHQGMARELERQARYLMATALLSRNEWRISADEVADCFAAVCDNSPASRLWADIQALARQTDEMDEAASRLAGFEALWMFEQFLLRLEERAS